MQAISVIVCFGIAEPQVDDLIDATRGTTFQSARWLVFGRDMPRLAGLAAYWRGQVEVIIVHLPEVDADAQDAALLILENESVSVSNCIWLQCEDLQCPLPAVMRAARLDSCGPEESLSLLRQLAMIDAGGSD